MEEKNEVKKPSEVLLIEDTRWARTAEDCSIAYIGKRDRQRPPRRRKKRHKVQQ